MSIVEGPQPIDHITAGQLLVEAAPLQTISRREQSAQDLRESGQDSRETSQDTRESGQDLRESGQNLRETGQDLREVGADSRETAQDARETRQDLRKSGQDMRETSQDLRAASQDTRELDQKLKESRQDLREANQSLRESNLALLESENWFRLLVDSVTDYAIYMLDPEGRVVTWNVGAERSKGYKAEEILGRNYSIFFPPEDAEAGLPADELATAVRLGRYETETWRVRKNGARFWVLVTLTAIHGPRGELLGFANVTRDLTAQKAAEEALRSRNAELERYRFIVGSVADYVIFTLDEEGRIDSWSDGARNVLGYNAEEALGREYSMVFTPAEIETGAPRLEMEEAARTGHCTTESWRVRRNGSLFWASGALTAVRDETGKLTGYIRVARDMTQHKHLEESLAKMAGDLEIRVVERTRELEITVEELQRKNREVEAFVYIVSHDLRAPLVNVQGFVRELEESGTPQRGPADLPSVGVLLARRRADPERGDGRGLALHLCFGDQVRAVDQCAAGPLASGTPGLSTGAGERLGSGDKRSGDLAASDRRGRGRGRGGFFAFRDRRCDGPGPGLCQPDRQLPQVPESGLSAQDRGGRPGGRRGGPLLGARQRPGDSGVRQDEALSGLSALSFPAGGRGRNGAGDCASHC